MKTNASTGRPIWGNIAFLSLTPIAAAILVPIHALTHGITLAEISAATALWMLTGLGITTGYHRLFSHRSYQAVAPVRLFFAILGAAAWQNSIIVWAAGHRFHHRDVDTDGDPYNAKKGLAWSHIGWIMVEGTRHNQLDNVSDLLADPICRWQHRNYLWVSTAVNLGIPFLLGLWTGDIIGMMIIAGLLRVVLVHHFTFTINSLAHKVGTQTWSTLNTSRDSWVISLLSFGEGYHNYHHAFQTDYRNGPRWYNYDPSKWLIWSLQKMRLAKKLRTIPLDIALRRRFEERRTAFSEWMDTRVSPRAHEVAHALAEQLENTQARLEASLAEFSRTRKQWSATRTKVSQHEVRALRRSLRKCRRAVKATMREWDILLQDYTALHGPMGQAA